MAVQATSTSVPVASKGSTLAARQARLAFLLLLPTFVILVLLAFYPLARTVTASFTDEPFARPDQPINQVGFANYQTLLGIQLVQFPQDASLGDVLPRAADGTRYRRVSTFDLFGTRYVLAGRVRTQGGAKVRIVANTLGLYADRVFNISGPAMVVKVLVSRSKRMMRAGPELAGRETK